MTDKRNFKKYLNEKRKNKKKFLIPFRPFMILIDPNKIENLKQQYLKIINE